VDLETFKVAGAKNLEKSYALYDSSVAALDGLLASRIDKFSRQRMLSHGLVVGSLLVVMFVVIAISRSITRLLSNLAQIAQRISEGATDAKVELEGEDEVGQLAQAIRLLLASTQSGSTRSHQQSRAA
jgi:HAMP domain-containing protein